MHENRTPSSTNDGKSPAWNRVIRWTKCRALGCQCAGTAQERAHGQQPSELNFRISWGPERSLDKGGNCSEPKQH